jgi:hypothetical protein
MRRSNSDEVFERFMQPILPWRQTWIKRSRPSETGAEALLGER